MSANMPKYIEMYSVLRQAILSGEYPANSYLPTENELMKLYGVSKTTVRHAVSLLRDQNMLEVRQGSGTRILPMEHSAVQGQKYNVPDSEISVLASYSTEGSGVVSNTKAVLDRVPAPEAAALALKLAPLTEVYRLQRIQLADGHPFGYMVNYLSVDAFPDLAEKGELTTNLYGFLMKHYGKRVTDIEETIDAITAGFMESQYLQVETGTPLLLLKRIAVGGKTVIEYCESIMRPDLFHMTVKISSPRFSDTPYSAAAQI